MDIKHLPQQGIGVLYVKYELFDEMTPFMGGGDMIKEVTFEKTTYNDPPLFLEAGTPNISGAIALATALDYMNNIGLKNIQQHEDFLLHYATEQIRKFNNINIVGQAEKKTSVISFLIEDTHPFDVGTLLDQMGIAIRIRSSLHSTFNGLLRNTWYGKS